MLLQRLPQGNLTTSLLRATTVNNTITTVSSKHVNAEKTLVLVEAGVTDGVNTAHYKCSQIYTVTPASGWAWVDGPQVDIHSTVALSLENTFVVLDLTGTIARIRVCGLADKTLFWTLFVQTQEYPCAEWHTGHPSPMPNLPLSRECPCGIFRLDCEYHRP